RGPAIAAALDGRDTGPVTFDVELVLKDLRTILEEARRRGATMPVVERTLAIYEDAAKAGWAARDAPWLPAVWPSKHPKEQYPLPPLVPSRRLEGMELLGCQIIELRVLAVGEWAQCELSRPYRPPRTDKAMANASKHSDSRSEKVPRKKV